MAVSNRISKAMTESSWIRQMFEIGIRMKKNLGAENVFDFTLGNPSLEPPEELASVVKALIDDPAAGTHGYMPNAGFQKTREAVAVRVSEEQEIHLGAEHIIMTVGAGGALNTVFRAILNPGDEVLVSRPFFPEYSFYADNHGGILKTAPSKDDFDLDIEAMEKALSPRTKIVLINSPNNPTGKIYSAETLAALKTAMDKKALEYGNDIYVVSDEPYRKITYDNRKAPGTLSIFPNAVVCSSYSKDLGLAGERIGYIAVSPKIQELETLRGGLILANRILGFVNAPALMQRAVAKLQGTCVDISFYKKNRDLLLNGLRTAGYQCREPEGAFYLFPNSPIPDDAAFVGELQKENILAVPGRGFAGPGYFRLAYCCSPETIIRSIPGFKAAIDRIHS